jgi:hypothetical protein
MRGMLADSELKPSKEQILATTEKLKELLRIRRSTALLGLRASNEVSLSPLFLILPHYVATPLSPPHSLSRPTSSSFEIFRSSLQPIFLV